MVKCTVKLRKLLVQEQEENILQEVHLYRICNIKKKIQNIIHSKYEQQSTIKQHFKYQNITVFVLW